MRPPPALPSRDSAAAGAVCSDTRAVTRHLRAPGTVARSRESPALIKGCGHDDGALRCSVFKTVSTGPRGTVRLLRLARRALRQRSRRRVPAECRAAFRSASRRAQVGDTGRGCASGPVFAQRGRCPRLCCPTRRETPARFREKAAFPPARTRFVLWRLRCRARLVTPEFGFLTAPVLRNGGARRAMAAARRGDVGRPWDSLLVKV